MTSPTDTTVKPPTPSLQHDTPKLGHTDQSHKVQSPSTIVEKKSHIPKPAKRRHRGLDEIKPFLHEVDKIVTEEASKHTTGNTMPWYILWQKWKSKDLFNKTSMNSITTVICPDLHYNQRTIRSVVERCLRDITPIDSYIDITNLSDKSVSWCSKIEVTSFKSVRGRKHRHLTKKTTKAMNLKTDDDRSINSLTSSRNSSLTSRHGIPILNPELPSSIQLLTPGSTSLTHSNEKSLTANGYSELKMTAIAELMESTTNGLTVITKAKETAVTTLKEDYDKILAGWDETKAKLDFESKLAITDLHVALTETSQVSTNSCMIRTDLDEAKAEISNIDASIDNVIEKATSTETKVTRGAVEDALQEAIHDMQYH